MILFDIGANSGDAVLAGLKLGYNIIALEPAPKVYKNLVCNFLYNENVVPIKMAVSDKDNQVIEFYEADQDGLSTMNKDWLTLDGMPYNGIGFRTIKANTVTIDTLVKIYGIPDLIKIDVEGAEWSVLKGMSQNYGKITFEWTYATIDEHNKQLKYLESIGYTEVAPQFIVHHLEEPIEWFPLNGFNLDIWIAAHKDAWEKGKWQEANLRPTSDVGMVWVK